MKMLLINPPMQENNKTTFPSFGIAYITHELRKHGYSVEILDIDAYRYSKPEVTQLIEKSGADIIGIGGLVTVYPYLHWLIPEIRKLKPEVKIILGGPIAASLNEKCFEKFAIDYEVIGEGEITIIELLRALETGAALDDIRGIGFKKDGKIIYTKARPLMPSLEGVPIFDDKMFPMESLLKNAGGVFQIHTQRGCPMNCTFCFNSFRVIGKEVRYRPVNNVVNEIELFSNKYREMITLFAISGECITSNREWLIGFCEELIKRKLNIPYRVTSRVDTIDAERLDWLKKSGCVKMSLGLESGSDKILKIMKKGTTVEKSKKTVALAKRFLPNIDASIMLGYIGETPDTLKETVKFCKEISVEPAIFYTLPLPGTELYKMAVEKNFIRNEEEYLMGLNGQTIFDFSVNLTDMRDDAEAKREMETAFYDIKRYYFWKKMRSPSVYKKTISKLIKRGFKRTVGEILHSTRKDIIGIKE